MIVLKDEKGMIIGFFVSGFVVISNAIQIYPSLFWKVATEDNPFKNQYL